MLGAMAAASYFTCHTGAIGVVQSRNRSPSLIPRSPVRFRDRQCWFRQVLRVRCRIRSPIHSKGAEAAPTAIWDMSVGTTRPVNATRRYIAVYHPSARDMEPDFASASAVRAVHGGRNPPKNECSAAVYGLCKKPGAYQTAPSTRATSCNQLVPVPCRPGH